MKKGVKLAILAIDPGLSGAFVLLHDGEFQYREMPIKKNGKFKEVDAEKVIEYLSAQAWWWEDVHVLLERAHAGAMGVTAAFNYGRGFATLEIALQLAKLSTTYVEPAKWTKVMHEGISADLKPKAKSILAVKRLFPKLVSQIPTNRNGRMHEGVVDALLLAGYGQRILK